MNRRTTAVLGFALMAFSISALPADSQDAMAAADAKILVEIAGHNQLMENLEYLSDIIGPRLTGSPRQIAASEWAAQKFREYGLTSVHQEPWPIAHAWTRGVARARLVSPVSRSLALASLGWSVGTAGVVRGPVIYVDGRTTADLEKYRGALHGAIVIYQPPRDLAPPYLEGHPPIQFPLAPPSSSSNASRDLFAARAELFKSEGVVAILRDSNRPYNLLTMSNGASGEYQPSAAPTAVIAHEDYLLLLRLLARAAVTMELEMTNSLSAGPVEVSNTVAEIRGAAHPDEVVILAAHLDSWDLASGSTDNGAGAMAVLEAARALAQLHLQPRRTIRFVLFTGEEQGEIGSERYVAAHRNELAKISAVLVNDTGTSRVVTLGLHANYQDREAVDRVLAPLAGLNLLEPKMTRTYGSDYAPFNEAGVPGFSCIGDSPEYFETQHTQIDTFDKIHKDDITQAAQVMAGWAYNTAELPEMLPR